MYSNFHFYWDPYSPWVYERLLENKLGSLRWSLESSDLVVQETLFPPLPTFRSSQGTGTRAFIWGRMTVCPSVERVTVGQRVMLTVAGNCLFLTSHEPISCPHLGGKGNRHVSLHCQRLKTFFTRQCSNCVFTVTFYICYQASIYHLRDILKIALKTLHPIEDIFKVFKQDGGLRILAMCIGNTESKLNKVK